MTNHRLIYRWDTQRNEKRLFGDLAQLDENYRRTLETELASEYEQLLASLERRPEGVDFQVRVLDADGGQVVTFRITFGQRAKKRSPELVLEPLGDALRLLQPASSAGASSAPARTPPADVLGRAVAEVVQTLEAPRPAETGLASAPTPAWTSVFLADLARRLPHGQRRQLRPAERIALEFALDELGRVCRDESDHAALILLAGYLALSERRCEGGDLDDRGLYVLAARALDRLCGDAAARWDQAAESSRPPREIAANLRGVFGFLRRALGLEDV